MAREIFLETEENWDNLETEITGTMTEKDIDDLLADIGEY